MSFEHIVEQQDKIKQIMKAVDTSKIAMPRLNLEAANEIANNSAVKALQCCNIATSSVIATSTKALKMCNAVETTVEELRNNNNFKAIGEFSINSKIPTFQFDSQTLKAFDKWNSLDITNIISKLMSLVQSSAMQELQSITSSIGRLLQAIDISTSLKNVLEKIKKIECDFDYKNANEIYLEAMFDAKWFPYAGWIADYIMVDEILEILNTSRASKNRIKRIDKVILSYYSKEEINNLKREWRQMNLPSYMTRILVQSVQAYHRREYALTVSALVTLWEGIICEKTYDASYRFSKKTRNNLTQLIEGNEFGEIFSSFCNEFIFYKCEKPDEVKPDVPGRHSIAHCWYSTYPSKKIALNAILFTDFLLKLKPIDKPENESCVHAKNVNIK